MRAFGNQLRRGWSRWRESAPRERRAFVEAWLELLWAAIALRSPWQSRCVQQALDAPVGTRTPRGADVLWRGTQAASRHHVKPMLCLEQSLALGRMLRRRHAAVRLRIGVRRGGSVLEAHAWLEGGGAPPDARAESYASLDRTTA